LHAPLVLIGEPRKSGRHRGHPQGPGLRVKTLPMPPPVCYTAKAARAGIAFDPENIHELVW
jgi:hypothetical protein